MGEARERMADYGALRHCEDSAFTLSEEDSERRVLGPGLGCNGLPLVPGRDLA